VAEEEATTTDPLPVLVPNAPPLTGPTLVIRKTDDFAVAGCTTVAGTNEEDEKASTKPKLTANCTRKVVSFMISIQGTISREGEG